MGVEGQRQIFVDKANQTGVDVFAGEFWHDLLVEATAVAAFEITEFDDGEWCSGITQGGFPLQQ